VFRESRYEGAIGALFGHTKKKIFRTFCDVVMMKNYPTYCLYLKKKQRETTGLRDTKDFVFIHHHHRLYYVVVTFVCNPSIFFLLYVLYKKEKKRKEKKRKK
jgi:hypothetical protein